MYLSVQIDSDKEDDDSDVAAPEYSHKGNLSEQVILWQQNHPSSLILWNFLLDLIKKLS